MLPEGTSPGQILADPSGSLIRADDYRDDGVPVVMPRDLTDDDFSTTHIRYVAAERPNASTASDSDVETSSWHAVGNWGGVPWCATNMKTISLDVLRNLPIAVPDLESQRAIATVMTPLDDHKRMLQAQLKLTQELRREALKGLLKS